MNAVLALSLIFFFTVGSALNLSSAVRSSNKNIIRKYQNIRRDFKPFDKPNSNRTIHIRDTDNKLTRTLGESNQFSAIEQAREAETISKQFERSMKENQEKLTKFETESAFMNKIADLESTRWARSVNGNQLAGTEQEVAMTPRAASRTSVPRLLASGGEDRYFTEFNLEDKSRRQIPVYTGRVRAVVYDPTSQSIIWSNHTAFFWRTSDSGIFSVGVNERTVTALRVGVWTYGLAIDTARNLLFYGHWSSHGSIHVITTTGEDHKVITHLNSESLVSIALDPVRQHIYICQWSNLLRIDYDGNNKVVIAWGTAIQSVLVDTVHQMFYYNDFRRVVKTFIVTGDSQTVYQMDLPSWSMTSSDDVLYIGNVDGHIIALNMVTNVGTIIGAVQPDYVSVCLIPSMDGRR